MSDKTLAFQVEVQGVPKGALELEKVTLEVKQLAIEKAKLTKAYRDGLISEQQAIKELAKLNTQLVAAKKNQTELRDAVNKSMGVSSKFKNRIVEAGKELLGFGGYLALAATALNKLKDAFLETEIGVRVTKQWTEAVKTFFQSIIRGEIQMAGTNALAAAEVAKMMDEMRKGDRVDLVTIAKLQKELNELRLKGADVTKSLTEQLNYQNLASAKENELIEYKLKDKQEELKLIQTMLTLRPEDTKLLDMQAQIEAELLDIQGEKSLRIASKQSALRAKQIKEQEDANKAIIDGQKKLQEEVDDYNKEKADKEKKAKEELLKKQEEEKESQWRFEDEWGRKLYDQNRANAEAEFEAKKREADAIAEMEEAHLVAKMNLATSVTNLINGIAGKNKAIQKASLIADKALAIAEVIIQTKKANAATRAWGALGGPAGMVLAELAILKNNVAAGVNIAAISAAAAVGVAGISKYATGGKIQGGLQLHGDKSKDNTLIYVKQNETVLTESQVARLGGSGAMRKARVPGYAMGGYVGQQAPEIPSSGFDYAALARLIPREIVLDINKVNSAQKELQVITEPQRL